MLLSGRYIHFLSAIAKTEESLRRLKKGKRSTFSLFGGPAKEDDGQEEKIRAQMMLDVAAFGKDAESLGVAVQQSQTFKVLEDMAGASFTDGTFSPRSTRPIFLTKTIYSRVVSEGGDGKLSVVVLHGIYMDANVRLYYPGG